MDPRCSYLADDLILLDENVLNNGESEAGLFQIRAGVKIMDRDVGIWQSMIRRQA
jgi:hypothetical protein